nr:hypothetical protein [Tanacetum cinerariifolium]
MYDGNVLFNIHLVISVTDEEETLILKEESRSKMIEKQNDPISKEKKCSVDKKLFEIEKKELKLENKRLLAYIICQDVMNIVMHADDKSVNVLHVQNNFLDDNIALVVMNMENDRLMELLVS